jgi:hypothetical protein
LTRRLTSGFNLAATTILQSGNPFYVYAGNSLILADTAKVFVTADNYQSELAAGHINYDPSSGNYSADGDNNNVPNALSYKQKTDRKSYEYKNATAIDSGVITHAQFAPPAFSASGAEGNEKMNQFRNPGYADTDLTVKKTTAIAERISLELRLDTFNLFNRVNLNGVDANYTDLSANFGTTNSTMFQRYLQLV